MKSSNSIGKVKLIRISKSKGQPKEILQKVLLKENYGLDGDIHAGPGKKQVSILSIESKNKLKKQDAQGLCTLKFFDNITTEGIDLYKYSVGTKIKIGNAEIEISQVGKQCYEECSIPEGLKVCVLYRECIFTKVIKTGLVKLGDKIEILND